MSHTPSYNTALIIGRFQPFHLGHRHLLEEGLRVAENLVIAVGSSNVSNEQNPLPYDVRAEMIKLVADNEAWGARIFNIVPSPDFPRDGEWLRTLLENVGDFDVALGNNDWTNGVLEQAGYEVIRVPHWERGLYEGTLIRQLINNNDSWKERVPQYLWDFLSRSYPRSG